MPTALTPNEACQDAVAPGLRLAEIGYRFPAGAVAVKPLPAAKLSIASRVGKGAAELSNWTCSPASVCPDVLLIVPEAVTVWPGWADRGLTESMTTDILPA